MQKPRVVITGIGAFTPLGNDMDTTWAALLEGKSGVAPITRFDPKGLPVHVACEVKNFDPSLAFDAKELRRTDLFEQYAMAAAKQAMKNSGLVITPELAPDVGVVVGSAVGGFSTLISQSFVLREQGARRINVFAIPMIMANGASGMIAIETGAQGPSYSPVSACATSNDSIGQAFDLIRHGKARAIIAGGADATVSELGMAGFDRVTALSHDNELPSKSPKPFDKKRDGTLMGEGACVMILEDLELAKSRGANILAEIIGYGQTTDAFHVIAPSEGGVGAGRCISRAIKDAGIDPSEIDYINAHGTATPLNDIAETQAIKLALGDHAYKVAISSTKSMTGHMMGATGSLEAAVCVYAIKHGIMPGTMNLTEPDEQCDLDYIPLAARKKDVRVAMNNSFGFGGHNSVVIFKRFEE
ncbi:MAG TPA: beta-ketoacyl-ACP synthase II [Thermoflexales bacterium]|nr:beta-ketoacyl-ACP synthase II [Thermoflexales bacterium]HQW35411.1 beta-ketoacyl-ACP synthase II [Thermoflexales bacterium]HQZ22141.1 beta-ketoacyl-ACP synthase II [Thermoflexales bacterium]